MTDEFEQGNIDPEKSWYDYGYLAAYIAPRVRLLAERTTGHPCHIPEDEWQNILWSITTAMETINAGGVDEHNLPQVQAGCELLGKHFMNLWD